MLWCTLHSTIEKLSSQSCKPAWAVGHLNCLLTQQEGAKDAMQRVPSVQHQLCLQLIATGPCHSPVGLQFSPVLRSADVVREQAKLAALLTTWTQMAGVVHCLFSLLPPSPSTVPALTLKHPVPCRSGLGTSDACSAAVPEQVGADGAGRSPGRAAGVARCHAARCGGSSAQRSDAS